MSCYAHFLYTFLNNVLNIIYNFLITKAKRRRQIIIFKRSQLAPGCTLHHQAELTLSNAPRSHVVRSLYDLSELPHNSIVIELNRDS